MTTLPNLLRIASTADSLEAWLHANTGSNDDWLVTISADEESGRKLCTLLQNLRLALAPYRNARTYAAEHSAADSGGKP